MKNIHLENLNKIEFVITYACTGRCKHCSEGDHAECAEHIDPALAADAVRTVAEQYDIKTVMCFGGEPLLYVDAVEQIMRAATEMSVPRRQVITNGYFTTDAHRIGEVARRLSACGVNDLLISVDAFHQETIPLDIVRAFAEQARICGLSARLHPAWLVSPSDENPYNLRTRELLLSLADLGLPVSDGNVVFPEGNARKFLAEYFTDTPPENPYVEDLRDVRCISFSPNGDVLGGNIYRTDIADILSCYTP